MQLASLVAAVALLAGCHESEWAASGLGEAAPWDEARSQAANATGNLAEDVTLPTPEPASETRPAVGKEAEPRRGGEGDGDRGDDEDDDRDDDDDDRRDKDRKRGNHRDRYGGRDD